MPETSTGQPVPPQFYRPEADEYPAGFAGYIGLVPDGDVLDAYFRQPNEFRDAISCVPESFGNYAYAKGKWTVKELLGHITDVERALSYRILRFARADETPVEGFDEDLYARNSRASDRSIADHVEEFGLVRRANCVMVQAMNGETLVRRGTANGNIISVRALILATIGHVRHHENILFERYLAGSAESPNPSV